MEKIDSGYDVLLKSNFELYKVKFKELQETAKSWYAKDTNFRSFDERSVHSNENALLVGKVSGLINNLIFAYKEDDKFYLMDGFNRLFTEYSQLDLDVDVYLKVLTTKLENHQLMRCMFYFNLWKLSNNNYGNEFKVQTFFDRGMRLFLYEKFNIDFYIHRPEWQHEEIYANLSEHNASRPYSEEDLTLLDYYFRKCFELADYFKLDYDDVFRLFSQERIIDDIQEIIAENKYKEKPFPNYHLFFRGFIMFLSKQRIKGDTSEQKFQTYVNLLKEDKKFFKKLQGMYGNDSTRKNIYHWFNNLNK